MAAKTHPRFNFPYTGRRYGSFSGKLFNNVPDFMHGTLSICPYLSGNVEAKLYLSGKLNTVPHLDGDVRTNP